MVRMHERWFFGDKRQVWRDEGMATNLSALAKPVVPGRRIIVWAHNGHVARHFPTTVAAATDDRPMGMFLDQTWGASAHNDRTTVTVAPHSPGSLEAIIGAAGQAPLFLPFTPSDQAGDDDDWLHRPI